MREQLTPDSTTAGESIRHWLSILTLTLLGLLVAELPVFSRTRDRVYLWLQQRQERDYKSVVVLAIDDDEFWRGEPAGKHPLSRKYLAKLVTTVSKANPAVIALDVGFEMNDSSMRPQWERLTDDERSFLVAIEEAAKVCPIILPRTISGDKRFVTRYDLFDAKTFGSDSRVAFGHTSAARDPRQIPTRVSIDSGQLLDSFPVAVLRRVMRKLPARMEDPDQPWPYSFFLPNSAFVAEGAPVGRDGLTPVSALRQVTPNVVKRWLERQIVFIGGTWRKTSHGGDFEDAHEKTPLGTLPGVVLHADYVQSVLWGPMYGMPRRWRLAIEILLSMAVSLFFLIAHGWQRLLLVVATLLAVIALTWVFSSAIGVFFDMVVPIAFIGLHALWEGASETFRLEFRRSFRYSEHVFTSAAVAAVLGVGIAFVSHEVDAAERQLATEDRLQVTMLAPAPAAPQRFLAAPAGPPASLRELPDEFNYAQIFTPSAPDDEREKMAEQPRALRKVEQKPTPEQPSIAVQQPLPPKLEATPKPQLWEAPRMAPDLETEYAAAGPTSPTHAGETWQFYTNLPAARVRLASAGVSASSLSERPVLNLIIEHDAPLKARNAQIAFTAPRGNCSEQVTDAAMANLTASGSRVLGPSSFQSLLSRQGLVDPLDPGKVSRIGRILGPGVLVNLTVDGCTSDVRAGGTLAAFLGATSATLGRGNIRASVQIVDLTDGSVASVHRIDATAMLTAKDTFKSQLVPYGSSPPDKAEKEEWLREKLAAEAAEQIRHLFFDWTEEVQLPIFDDSSCQLQNAVTKLQENQIRRAAISAEESLDLCLSSHTTERAMLAKAHYNVAVTKFLSGENEIALAHLHAAQQLNANTTFDTAQTIFLRTIGPETAAQLSRRSRAEAAPADKAPSNDRGVEELLRRLDDTYQKGLITKEEYDRKRREILELYNP